MATTTAYDEENKGPTLLAAMWSLTGLAAIMVAMRLFIRTKIIRNLGLDDWLIAVSIALGIANVIVVTIAVHHGYVNMTIAISWIFGILSFAIPKLGIAALLDRILNPSLRTRCALWGLTGFIGIIAILNIIIFFTSCNPPRALWTTVPGATCRPSNVLIGFATFNGCISAVTDLSLAIYPTLVLGRLQMSLRKKIALCLALGVGTISACAAIIKTTKLKVLADVADATYGSWPLVLWTNMEADLVVLGSCIPTLQPLLEFILGKRTLKSSSYPHAYPSYEPSASHQNRPRASRRNEYTLQSDSEENILAGKPKNWDLMQIHRTDDVVVQYEMGTQPQGNTITVQS
ncbi:hypothetical protein BDV25DRAFT_126749 [Aspergillus avenaceus]|uniref:Rhodopsin domain-containing protein n=1 Tax=Aspergillus avenaceus TaxID=36643 RepID=A0A5N6U635_ASPAV|nr:hypothetical protein BDV25DRAFT_126749 [Aspergillus avenaceus]